MLAKDALEIVLDPGPGFYSYLFFGGKGDRSFASHDRPLSLEWFCSANTVPDGDRSLCATLRPRRGFPSFH